MTEEYKLDDDEKDLIKNIFDFEQYLRKKLINYKFKTKYPRGIGDEGEDICRKELVNYINEKYNKNITIQNVLPKTAGSFEDLRYKNILFDSKTAKETTSSSELVAQSKILKIITKNIKPPAYYIYINYNKKNIITEIYLINLYYIDFSKEKMYLGKQIYYYKPRLLKARENEINKKKSFTLEQIKKHMEKLDKKMVNDMKKNPEIMGIIEELNELKQKLNECYQEQNKLLENEEQQRNEIEILHGQLADLSLKQQEQFDDADEYYARYNMDIN